MGDYDPFVMSASHVLDWGSGLMIIFARNSSRGSNGIRRHGCALFVMVADIFDAVTLGDGMNHMDRGAAGNGEGMTDSLFGQEQGDVIGHLHEFLSVTLPVYIFVPLEPVR